MMLMKSILHVLLSGASDIAYIVLYNECSGPEQLVLCTSLCVAVLPESDHGLSEVVGYHSDREVVEKEVVGVWRMVRQEVVSVPLAEEWVCESRLVGQPPQDEWV